MKTTKKVKLTGSMSEIEGLLNTQMNAIKGGDVPQCSTCATCSTCSNCFRRVT